MRKAIPHEAPKNQFSGLMDKKGGEKMEKTVKQILKEQIELLAEWNENNKADPEQVRKNVETIALVASVLEGMNQALNY